MAKLDPRLRFLHRSGGKLARETARRFGARNIEHPNPTVEVLVRLAPGADPQALKKAGMRVRARIAGPYPVVSGEVPLAVLPDLEKIADVHRVEASRELGPELDRCVPDVRADLIHETPPGIRGGGTLIGIADLGIDYRHPDFRDASGRTRIRFLWDQGGVEAAGGSVPYGREYSRDEINAVLSGAAAPADTPPADPDPKEAGHGTRVSGIAAGGGFASGTHIGLAPDAELVAVILKLDGVTPGRSDRVVEAFDYIVGKANGTPVAINLSRGMNGGGHAGETVVETAIDNLARRPDVAIIKSAGNEQPWRIHAGGTLTAGRIQEVGFEVSSKDVLADVIEIWFDDRDHVGIAIKPPGASKPTAFVGREGKEVFDTAAGNSISIDVDVDAERTGDTAATIILSRGTAPFIQPGTWQLLLKSVRIQVGRYDAWIERALVGDRKVEQTRFTESANDPASTVTIPGTARNVITVGSYVTRVADPPGAALGALSDFSGRGPTRYGRIEPDLVAPGEVIEAAQAGSDTVSGGTGTSFAAPVVAGAAALIMSQRRGLRSHQLRQILVRAARRDGAAIRAPDNAWGHGKIDVEAAVELARTVSFPVISGVKVDGTTISWQTDIETTGAVRYLQDPRHLLLGKHPQSAADLRLGKRHKIDLGRLAAGTYFCEVVAFSADNFYTEDDNAGRCYQVRTGKARTKARKR